MTVPPTAPLSGRGCGVVCPSPLTPGWRLHTPDQATIMCAVSARVYSEGRFCIGLGRGPGDDAGAGRSSTRWQPVTSSDDVKSGAVALVNATRGHPTWAFRPRPARHAGGPDRNSDISVPSPVPPTSERARQLATTRSHPLYQGPATPPWPSCAFSSSAFSFSILATDSKSPLRIAGGRR